MKIEKITPSPEENIGFYDFSAGINEKSGEAAKLIDAENVSLKGKKVVSRKGIKVFPSPIYRPESLSFGEIQKNEFTVFFEGEYRKIIVFYETDDATYVKYTLKMLGNTQEAIDLGEFRFVPESGDTSSYPLSVFAFAGDKTVGQGIYVIFSFATDPITMQGIFMEIYEYAGSGVWNKLNDSDIYTPTLYKNGRGTNYTISEKKFPEPQFPEKKNMLSKRSRYLYNADGVSGVFYLPDETLSAASGYRVNCTVQLADNTSLEFVVSASNIISQSVSYNDSDVSLIIDRTAKKLQFDGFVPPFIAEKTNTIEVIITEDSEENVKKIANMHFGMWYNAGSSGTRLFVAGNDFYPSLLIASSPDKPLYFPEDNQFYVGDPTQKITALARQNKSLVVFKEQEIYCGSYSSGKFSVSHLHSAIGCDLPATVALCGNRVVWATTEKCIYTLNALSDYGAVAVYRLSSKIENALENEDFSNACAGYKNDIYYLFLKDRVCVMNVSGALLQSNKQFLDSAAFTFWKMPSEVKTEFAVGMKDDLRLICSTENESGQIHYICSFSGNGYADEIMYRTDNSARIESKPFYSKLKFDNCPNIEAAKRSFHKAYISCYAENGVDVRMSDLAGDIRKNCRIDMKYTSLKLSAPYRIMPLIGGSNMVLQIESSGEFSCSGYTLYYRDFI